MARKIWWFVYLYGKGYEEAASKTKEIGRQEVNQYKIYIKFDCILVDPIVPPPKPKTPPKSELTT